jgi:ankyrin repeat protein
MIAMRKLSLITLMTLQLVPPLISSADTSIADGPSKPQRTSSSARDGAKQVRELVNAAANGNTGKVLELLDKGVNVDASFPKDDSEFSGMTALMVASSRDYPELVEQLIRRGADVNLKRYSGDTPLIFAARSGSVKTVKALLSAGADPNTQVQSPHAGEITPLNSAINTDNPNRIEVVRILIGAKAEVNMKAPFVISPLMHSVRDLELVKLLITSGADVNQKNFRGTTALMIAAGDGEVSVVRYLLEKGADVNARDKDGNTALTYAETQASRRGEIIPMLRRAQSARPR